MTSFYLCFVYSSTLNLYLTKYCHKNQIKLIWIKILKPGWGKSRAVWNGKTLHFYLRCAAFLQALPQTRCFVPVAMLAKPTKYGLSFPFHTVLLFPFRDFQTLFIYIFNIFCCRLYFCGYRAKQQNNILYSTYNHHHTMR